MSGHPSRLEIAFDRSLDDGDLIILIWQNRHFDRLEPLALRTTVDVPWSPGPSGVL
ncbi:MAG TPA: hypothetical protein VII82_11690 [Polyangiaceae bacterium]